MRAAPADQRSAEIRRKRLGRAVLFILQQAPVITDPLVRADIGTILLAGQAMDFAARLQGYRSGVTPDLARGFARLAGLTGRDLAQLLPVLQAADVLTYTVFPGGELAGIEEYVGITAPVIEQTYRVLDGLHPSGAEAAALHSVEIAAWAPLTQSQHLQQISQRGLADEPATDGLRLALAAGINRRIWSADLREHVVFNPHVWGTGQVQIASFLRKLPPAERDSIMGIFEQAAARPGIRLDQVTASPALLTSARRVGLVQAAKVRSSHGDRERTYVFSPLIQAADDGVATSEALHLRKLFVAHILFGQEEAAPGRGQIGDPARLVSALIGRGWVGPASNIGTDYHMLEGYGVVRVEPDGTGMAYLRLLKREIAEGGLDWLQVGFGAIGAAAAEPAAGLHHTPGSFTNPDVDRAQLQDEGAAREIMLSVVLDLRKEAQRAARADSAFPPRA